MTIPQWVLLGFSGWTLLILSGPIGIYRWSMILGGRAKVSDWRADKIQGSDWYQRAMRAHMNCVENLPVFAAIVLCATAAETTGPLLSWLSLAFIAARIFQTTTHILFEQTDRVASVRFGFFFVQLICMLIMSGRVAVSAAEQTMSERSSLSASMEFCPTPRIPRGMSSHPDGRPACLDLWAPRSSSSSAGEMSARTVLISGLGIAGPTLAYWLKAGGFEPTVVERSPRLRTGGYVIDFWGLGYDIAERMGLRKDIERIGYHVQELRIEDDRSRRVAGFEADIFRELTNGRYVTLGRRELSHLLFEKAAGISEVMFDNEIVSLEDGKDGVCVQFKHGQARQFDLVIGADGLHSQVRKLVFGPQHKFEKNLGYAVAAFEVSGYRPREEDVYVMHGHAGRSLGRFTMRENRTLFLFVFATGNDALPETLDGQKDLLVALYADDRWECQHILNELNRTQELYFDRVSQIRMPNWSQGRIGLVGDAGFCVSLLAGQGSALAMTSAYVLAGELARADGRHEIAFREYEEFLRAYIATKQAGAERFGGALAPRTEWGLWFRNQVMNAFKIPGLARLAVGREITDKLLLRDYCWKSV